ncbi:MAG: motility associated factor glycosyltransferase family protein [Spirochaetota bacterium]
MIHIEAAQSKSGEPTLSVRLDCGRTVRLHSAFDPVKEAARGVSQFETSPGRLILVAGCGLAYHVRLLREKYPNNAILVIERYPEIAEESRKLCPGNLEGCRIIHDESHIDAVLETMNISRFRGTSVFFHRQSYSADSGYYDTMVGEVSRYISSKISDLLTRFEFEERWVENIFTNIPALSRALPAHEFFHRFSGIPAILVSAGPSLKESAPELLRYRGRALIACVDTAYKVLLSCGVEPHIVMVLDAQKHSLLHFLGTHSRRTVLLADIVSCPQVMRRFDGEICISTTSKYYDDESGKVKRETTPCVDWLEQYTGPLGDVQSGGSVATSLFDFLLNCGCNSITLVGQDLAYTGRKIHATGTYHNERWLAALDRFTSLENINQNIIRRRKIRYVRSVSGETTILTDYVLDLYRRWFSDSARLVSIPVYNASRAGAYVDYTVHTDLDTVMQKHGSADVNIDDRIGQVFSKASRINTGRLIPALDSLEESVSALHALAREAYTDDDKYGTVLDTLETPDIRTVFAPFLKRTRTYLDRHELDDVKRRTLILDDVIRSSEKISALIRKIDAIRTRQKRSTP